MADEAPDVETAMEPLISTALGLLAAMTDAGELCNAPDTRNNLVHFLNNVHAFGKAACKVVAESKIYPALLFYERTRLGLISSLYYLDGLPARLPVFGAPVAFQFPSERVRELGHSDFIAERLHTLGRLEEMSSNSEKLQKLAESFDKLTDISKEVPLRARIFVSRVRSMNHGAREVRAPGWFKQCAHEQCGRLFLSNRNDMREFQPSPIDSQTQSDRTYWNSIHPMPVYEYAPLRFCSRVCGQQWHEQHRLLSCVKVKETDAPEKKLGTRAAVGAALEVALKRNSNLRTAIAKLCAKRRRAFRAISRVDFEREMTARVARANVDAALLYAATRVAASPQLSNICCLPGFDSKWRTQTGFTAAAKRARIMYDSSNRDSSEMSIVESVFNPPTFFREAGARAVSVLLH